MAIPLVGAVPPVLSRYVIHSQEQPWTIQTVTEKARQKFKDRGSVAVIDRNVKGCWNLGSCGMGCPTNAKIAIQKFCAIELVKNVGGRTCGPGLLCQAMRIDRHLNAHDLVSDTFYIAAPPGVGPLRIVKRPRIGVDYARQWAKKPLRFYIKGNPFVSRP